MYKPFSGKSSIYLCTRALIVNAVFLARAMLRALVLLARAIFLAHAMLLAIFSLHKLYF